MTVSSNTEFPLSLGDPPFFLPFSKDLLEYSLLMEKPEEKGEHRKAGCEEAGSQLHSAITVSVKTPYNLIMGTLTD